MQEADRDGSTPLSPPPLADYSDLGIEWTERERAKLIEIKSRKARGHKAIRWSLELRESAVEFLKTHTVAEVARMFQVPQRTVRSWHEYWVKH